MPKRRAHSISPSSSDGEQEKVIKREKISQTSNKSDSDVSDSDVGKSPMPSSAKPQHQSTSSSESSDKSDSESSTPTTPQNSIRKTVMDIKKEKVSNSDSESGDDAFSKNNALPENSKSSKSFEKSKKGVNNGGINKHIKSNESSEDGESEEEEEEVLKPSKHNHQCVDDSIYDECSKKSMLSLENISDDDCEFWIVQCPISMNPQHLLEKKLIFGSDSKLKIKLDDGSSQKLDTTSKYTQSKSVTCIVQGRKKLQAVQVPLQGKLTIAEHIEDIEELEDYSHLSDKTSKVPFPQGLKLRHPLFGAKFTKRLESVRRLGKQRRKRERASLAMESLLEAPQRKKRKIDVSPERNDEEELQLPRKHNKTESEISFVKKEIDTDIELDELLAKHKKKKSKRSKYQDDDD